MTSSDAGWWRRRSLAAKVIIIAVFILAVVLVGVGVWLGESPDIVPTEEPVDAESRALNTVLTNTLQSADIDTSLVDVTDERVYIAYSLPAFAYDETDAIDEKAAVELQRFAVGAAADTAPGVERIVIVQYDGKTPRLLWEVRMEDFDAFVAGDLTLDAFENRIQIKRYT